MNHQTADHRLELKELPRSQRLYQFLTDSLHYHFGYFQAPDDSIQDALNQVVLRCLPDLVPEGKTLDVGCGMGGTVSLLAEHAFPTLGIDPSRRSIELASSSCNGKKGVDFAVLKLQDLFTSFHYESPVFDNIMMIEVLQHFPDLEIVFEECYRLVRPEGVVVINDLVTIPPLAWEQVPLHKDDAIPKEAQAAGFVVRKYEAITARVSPTLDCMIASLQKQKTKLISVWSERYPEIEKEIDELLAHWANMRKGLLNGDLAYMTAVLIRP
ncbi:MAG: class I SAM-dependent methyltransferase [Planctomycetota bacterium]